MQPQERLKGLDLAKGLAIAFMVWVHVLITLASETVRNSTFGAVIGFLGGPPAAPVFMTAMGISFYYSKNKNLMASVKRGIAIILLGYILNFLRGVLPLYLVQQFLPSAAAGIPAAVANYTDAFLELDILQFAGLALIAMAVIRHYNVNRYLLLAAALVVAAISPALWGVQSPLPLLNRALDYIWGDLPSTEASIGNLVSFPFLPWFTFPLIGMFMGDSLVNSSTPSTVFRKMVPYGAVVFAIGIAMITRDPAYQMNDYYHSRFGAMLMMSGFVLIWLYICSIAVSYVEKYRVCQILFGWSRDITTVYVIQWILIMASADTIFGFNRLSHLSTLAVMIGITALTHFLNKAYKLKFGNNTRQSPARG